jgi:hypothetical protein
VSRYGPLGRASRCAQLDLHAREPLRERRCGRQRRHCARVVEGVDIPQRRQLGASKSQLAKARPLDGAGRRDAHRHLGEHPGVRAAQPDRPVTAVVGRSQDRVDAGREQRHAGPLDQRRRELRRVHPDDERRSADIVEQRRQALGEPVAALRKDLEAPGQPGAR